jgi:hypothetical protein
MASLTLDVDGERSPQQLLDHLTEELGHEQAQSPRSGILGLLTPVVVTATNRSTPGSRERDR